MARTLLSSRVNVNAVGVHLDAEDGIVCVPQPCEIPVRMPSNARARIFGFRMREKGSIELYPPQMDISDGEDHDDGDDEGVLPRMIGSHISILTDESQQSLWSPDLASLSLSARSLSLPISPPFGGFRLWPPSFGIYSDAITHGPRLPRIRTLGPSRHRHGSPMKAGEMSKSVVVVVTTSLWLTGILPLHGGPPDHS